jgi:chaperonin GroEL (HSP60 family)
MKFNNDEEYRTFLQKCAATALNSKLIHQEKEFFSKIAVDAVLLLDELLPLNMIGIKKVQGGGLQVYTHTHTYIHTYIYINLTFKIIYFYKFDVLFL